MKTRPLNSQPPGFEEFQRQMQEFLRQNFKSGGPGFTPPPPPPSGASSSGHTPPPEPKTASAEDFKFEYRPREVKEHLDRFVIKQEEAKKVLGVALCDHYHHVQQALQGRGSHTYAKQNVLLLGPTGVGKTYLIRSIAELIGVPFVKADATKFSETGYVGGDAEDLVRDLLRQANNDVVRAQYGIIYIDEIDKITGSHTGQGRDVSGRGVQTNLLKLMEETEVPARAPNDIAGQIQAMMDITQRGKPAPATINTRHVLFVVSGAFGGLEEIVRRRLRESAIGFSPRYEKTLSDEQLLEQAATRDFIDYGFEPEFIGRLPVRVWCHPLEVDDLFEILKTSEGSIIRQYENSFAAYNIDVLFQDDGLRRIAEIASEEKTGARGLMTVCERVFRQLKFELPSTPVRQFSVTRELVDNPDAALRRLIAEQAEAERSVLSGLVAEFATRFEEQHGLKLNFAPAAVEWLVAESARTSRSVRDLCAVRFKDFQFGLRLIEQNTGRKEFDIDERVARKPEKTLSEWVVASYRGNPEAETPQSSIETPPDEPERTALA
ncbi:AAA domain-containing protein [bacterium]|nr:AAA domain-containing protein [bacterium]